MSNMQDHPDIEKLPLEIDGIPVRETIREIFRNPENGTPDNISQGGCLALALKSSEIGGESRGYVIWNAWRKIFPVEWDQSKIDWRNIANFSRCDFRPYVINFSRFKFGDCANFKSAQWGIEADFNGTQWGDGANFEGARWGDEAYFLGAQWGKSAVFAGAQWGFGANFRGAQWDYGANFNGAQWDYGANFRGTQWGSGADFNGAQCGNGTDFSACTWEALRSAYSDEEAYQAAKSWAKIRDLEPDAFEKISFAGALFAGSVLFNERRFRASTNFSNNALRRKPTRDPQGRNLYDKAGYLRWEIDPEQRQFLAAPHFHGCELYQDTSFENAKFPPATGSEEAARAYRTLKLAFSKQQAIREEQRFFRLEMEEETLRETGLKRWLFKAYKTFSDYGFSTVLPMKYWGLGVLVFITLYGLLSWLGQCGLAAHICHFAPQWLEFSLLQTLPLPGLDKLSEAASKAFWPEGAWWGLALSVLVILHKTISLAALFLMGLALRNLFKLK